MADGALRAPLLGGGADGSEPLPSPGARAGRGLSIAALAPRASSNSSRGSLARSDDRPGPLAAAAAAAPAPHAGFEPPEAPRPGSGRGSGLRFAPAPPSRADSAASSAAASGRPSLSGMRSGGLSSSGALGVGMGKDTAAVLHRSASTKLMQLSAGFHSRAQLEEEEGITLPPSVIHPFDARCAARRAARGARRGRRRAGARRPLPGACARGAVPSRRRGCTAGAHPAPRPSPAPPHTQRARVVGVHRACRARHHGRRARVPRV